MTRSLRKGAGLTTVVGAMLMVAGFFGGGAANAHHLKRSAHHSTASAASPMYSDGSARSLSKSQTIGPPVDGALSKGPDFKSQQGNSPGGLSSIAPGGKESRKSDTTGPPDDAVKGPTPERNDTPANLANPIHSHGLDDNAIDTRITVQPRQNDAKHDRRPKKAAATSIAPRSLSRHHDAAPGAEMNTGRNSLGESVSRQNPAQVGRSATPSTSEHVVSGNAVTAGITHDEKMVPAKINLTAAPVAISHGAINGTSFSRARPGGASIGGPVKTIAGISGNAFHLRH